MFAAIFKTKHITSMRIVATYALLGSVWVCLSDVFSLSMKTNMTDIVLDTIFVIASSATIYYLILSAFTKNQEMEHKLNRNKDRLNLTLAAARMGVWEWVVQTNSIFWSPECFEIFGREIFNGKLESFTNIIHPEDADHVIAEATKALAEKIPYAVEFRIVRSDGEVRWVSNLARPNFDGKGNPLGLTGIVQDITESKLADDKLKELNDSLEIRIAERTLELEQTNSKLQMEVAEREQTEGALCQSEEKARMHFFELEEIYRSVPVGLGVLDTDLRFIRINDQLAEINGYSVEAHLGRRILELLPEIADRVETMLQQVLETGQPQLNIEFEGEIACNPGAKRSWLVNWLPIKNSDNRVIALSVMVEEVTQRKRAIEELQRHRTHLDSLIIERTEELEIRNRQLDAEIKLRKLSEKALRSYARRIIVLEEQVRKRLSAELHDEIGQNLSGLILNFRIISDALTRDSRARLGSRIEESICMFEEIGVTIRTMMVRLRPQVLDDYGLVAALKSHADQFSRRTGITVHAQIENTEPRLSEEVETTFFRIAQEALNNVNKHAEATCVTLGLESDEGRVRLSISDNGRGFDLQLKNSSDVGAGWGLSIMRERAESVGALFCLDSEAGRGTVISAEVGRSSDINRNHNCL